MVADKGYDGGDLVYWIVKILTAKAGIPIKSKREERITSGREPLETFKEKLREKVLKRVFTTEEQLLKEYFPFLKELIIWEKRKQEGY